MSEGFTRLTQAIIISPGALADSDDLYKGLQALAQHQQLQLCTSIESFKQALFGPTRHLHSLVARHANTHELLGFALFSYRWMTFSGEWVLYMNDIFVYPNARGYKVGQQLMQRLHALASEHQCSRLEWHCLTTNTPAQQFYHAIGAETTGEEWLTYHW